MTKPLRQIALVLIGLAVGVVLPRGLGWLRHFHLLPPKGGSLQSHPVKISPSLLHAVASCQLVIVNDSQGAISLVSTRGNALLGISELRLSDFPRPGYIQPLGPVPLAASQGAQPTSIAFLVDLPAGGLHKLPVHATLEATP